MNREIKRKPNSIKTRVTTLVSAAILFSVIFVSMFNYYRYVQDYCDKSITNEKELVEQIVLNIETYIDELSRLCLTPYYDSDVMAELEKDVDEAPEFLHKKRVIEDYLRQIMIMPRKDIISVFVCSDAVYSCTRQRYQGFGNADYKESEWFKKALDSNGYVYSMNVQETNFDDSVFSFSKSIKSFNDNNRILGVIRVDANLSGINDVCNRVYVEDDSALFIVDSELNTIYCNTRLKKDIDFTKQSDLIEYNGEKRVKIDENEYFIVTDEIQPIGWHIVSINSKRQITREAVNSLKTSGLFAIAFCVLGVVVSIWAIQRYLKPLYRTIDVMQEAKEGNLNVRAQEESTYEIKELNETFNQMFIQIQSMFNTEKEMTRQIYETELLHKEALMESLYHQIQPHFLYNTLNSISILIKCNRNEDAIRAVEELSVLMRGVTNSNQDLTLEEEINITESYMKLQKLRIDSLDYLIEIGDEVKNHLIPALSIQPLVENALVHGFDDITGEKFVSIKSYLNEDTIAIEVTDNGIGIGRKRLQTINSELEKPITEMEDGTLGKRVGLINIHRRIRLKHGDRYGIKLFSVEGKGTTVIILLPR